MSANGVWRIEQLSIDGWESVGAAFLEDGRYLRGGNHAYTAGRYELDGDRILITATSTRFGGGGAVYGTDVGEVKITLEGEMEGDTITAEATDGKFVAHYRYSRLADLP